MAAKATKRIPSYRRQRMQGRADLASVQLGTHRVYLGRYDTPESRARYDHVIAEWLSNDRQSQGYHDQ